MADNKMASKKATRGNSDPNDPSSGPIVYFLGIIIVSSLAVGVMLFIT